MVRRCCRRRHPRFAGRRLLGFRLRSLGFVNWRLGVITLDQRQLGRSGPFCSNCARRDTARTAAAYDITYRWRRAVVCPSNARQGLASFISSHYCWPILLGYFSSFTRSVHVLGSLAVNLSDHAAKGQNLQILKRRDRNVSTENVQIEPMDRAAIQPGDLPRPNGNTATRAQFDAKS